MKKIINSAIDNSQGMLKTAISISFILVSIFLSSCSNSSSSENGETETSHEHDEAHENEMTASLTQEQIQTIGIELGGIEQKQLTASLKANGVLKVPNQNMATVTAMTGGVIKSILVQPGNTVQKGQAIATLTGSTLITMQEELISVSVNAQLAEIDFKRQQELQQGNATALKTLQQTEAELKTLQARKTSLQKQLELVGINTANLSSETIQSWITIASPIDGSVSEVLVNIGSFIEANNPIATVVDNSQLHLDLYVYEKDLPKLKEGQTIHFTLTNNPGKEYDAKIYGVSNTFEANTKAIAIHAQVLGNKSGLIDGMSITAIVSLNDATVTAVPSDAVVSFEGQDFIFVVTDPHNEEEHHVNGDGDQHDSNEHQHAEEQESNNKESHAETDEITFERIPVAKGTTDVGYSEITLLGEIPANARIVTKGAFFVLSKMTNSGEGHEH